MPLQVELGEDAADVLVHRTVGDHQPLPDRGVAQPLGSEVGFQTVKQWAERNVNGSDKVLVKLDFANAFNGGQKVCYGPGNVDRSNCSTFLKVLLNLTSVFVHSLNGDCYSECLFG